MKCRICHRPLSDPESIALGVGPICRMTGKNAQAGQLDIFKTQKSRFDVVSFNNVICITDEGSVGTKAHMSVTNDVHRVLKDVFDRRGYSIKKRVIYRDSRMIWDEIVHEGGRFLHFAHLGVKEDVWEAIAAIKKNRK